MPPSGDELILKLLSQSVARLESSDRKRKQEEAEVTFLKSVKKVKENEPEDPTANIDIIEPLVVYHHLTEVSPKLAEELSTLQVFTLVLNHLKKVSPDLAEELAALDISDKTPGKKKITNKKAGVTLKRFTPQEDDTLKIAIKDAGEGNIDNVIDLAKRLNRPVRSVTTRIETLKRNGGIHKKMHFTLIEDVMVLEHLVIPRVGKEKLSEIVLRKHHYADLNMHLNKSSHGVLRRWANVLQPWLLQHYSGTLNLRVERMLAKYISDTFTDFSSIDWPEVAARSEFAGHTSSSLKSLYFSHLCRGAKSKLGLKMDEMTTKHIAEHCELVPVYGKGGDSESSNRMQRQRDIISYFERKVMELNLKRFV